MSKLSAIDDQGKYKRKLAIIKCFMRQPPEKAVQIKIKEI